METIFDYCRSVESVAAAERGHIYPMPLKAKDHIQLFEKWTAINPEAIQAMDAHAIEVEERCGIVSAKYIFEWLRYDTDIKLHPVEFWDDQGQRHRYGISNSLSPLYARRLEEKYHLKVKKQRSMFDGLPLQIWKVAVA